MNRPPYRPRQNSRVQASSGIRRVKKPAILKAAADAMSSSAPSQGRSVSCAMQQFALTGADDSGCMLTASCQEPFRCAMRRADRLFDIIRILRAARRPVTAAVLADEL